VSEILTENGRHAKITLSSINLELNSALLSWRGGRWVGRERGREGGRERGRDGGRESGQTYYNKWLFDRVADYRISSSSS